MAYAKLRRVITLLSVGMKLEASLHFVSNYFFFSYLVDTCFVFVCVFFNIAIYIYMQEFVYNSNNENVKIKVMLKNSNKLNQLYRMD